MGTIQSENELLQRLRELESDLTLCKEELTVSREREKRLSLIVQGSSIPTLVVDANHVITHCNKAYERLKGIAADRMIGTRNQWMTFYSRPEPVMLDFIVDRVPEEHIMQHFSHRCRKSQVAEGAFEAELFFPDIGENGEWLFFTTAPLLDEEGRLVGAVETIQNVTQRKRAEEALRDSERRFRSFIDFAPYPMGVFTMEGLPTYLNSRFTEVFGWTLDELQGKKIPFVPEEEKRDTVENLKRLYRDKILMRHESKRLTKDSRLLDVAIRAAIYTAGDRGPSGVVAIFRDITEEKRIARINEAVLRISIALPRYPNLEDLLDYVNEEVRRLLDTEGSIVNLLDEEKQEFFVMGAAYDREDMERRVKGIRFGVDEIIAGRVVKSGKPIIVSDTSKERRLHEDRDRKLGYKTRNLALVPLRTQDRIGGALCAINKKQGDFEQRDIELLEMISGTVALSIENARVSEELKKAYQEVSSLNRAKDKVINHLSHELRTPVAVLAGSLNLLTRSLQETPDQGWKPIMNMAERNLDRVKEIQYEAQDIMEGREESMKPLLPLLLDHSADELAILFALEVGDVTLVDKVKKKVDEAFGPITAVPQPLDLDQMVRDRLDHLGPSFSHRQVEIVTEIQHAPKVFLPADVLRKVIDGLLKNALENTPDEGRMEVVVRPKGEGALLAVRDYGVGILEDAKKRIFEGFFSTRSTMDYSTKRPFDFGAGGKGADLLRIKIFSERYRFQIDMASSRCRFIPEETDLCPGRISKCRFCTKTEDCLGSGGTVFTIYFPPAP